MLSEVLSMGDLSKILSGINFKDLKTIAKSISSEHYLAPVLTNWIHNLLLSLIIFSVSIYLESCF